MHDSASETSIYSQDISAFPGVQTSGIFVIEFLLTGSVYCYGFYYPTLSKADSLLHKNELWFPVGFLAFFFITNSWNGVFCKNVLRKRYELAGLSFFVSLLAGAKILAVLLKDNLIKFLLHGCFEGTCVSITLKLLEKSTLKCFQNRQRFAFTSALGRLLGLFTIPHLLQASITNIGVFYTGLLHATILLNVIPVGWIIFKASITNNKLSKHITMLRLNNENNVNIENMDGLWVEEDNDDEDEHDLVYKCISNNGVEILPVIYEDEEENYVYSITSINLKTNSAHKKKLLKISVLYVRKLLCIIIIIINKLILNVTLFSYLFIITQITLTPSYTLKNLLITLTSSSWIITSIIMSCSFTKMFAKLMYFLIGLSFLVISCYFIQDSSYDYRKAVINSMFLGIEFGIIFTFAEDISRHFLKYGNIKMVSYNIINLLCGIIFLVAYLFMYIFGTFHLKLYLTILLYLISFNLIINVFIFIYLYLFKVFKCIKEFMLRLKQK